MTRRIPRIELAGAALSLAVIIVGAWWWAAPSSYPFGSRDRVTVSLSHLFEHDLAGTMMIAAGVIGLAVSLLATRATVRPLIQAGVVSEVLFFGVVMSDAGIMSVAGYAGALLGPVALTAILVMACVRRQRSGFVALAVLAALVALGLATGFFTGDTLLTYVSNLATAFGSYGARTAWTLANVTAFAVWLLIAVRAFGGPDLLSRKRTEEPSWAAPAAAARWGRIATIAAALCPLPYALYRLTWLTPWPTDAGLTGPSLSLALRLQGSLIGFAALIASVLTLGLISRWGEIFPRWMPVWHDRPVPVRLPVIAGGLVAGALCLASPGMVVNAIERDMLFMLMLFPYPLWGVLLAAAVFAYWLRRRPSPAELRSVPAIDLRPEDLRSLAFVDERHEVVPSRNLHPEDAAAQRARTRGGRSAAPPGSDTRERPVQARSVNHDIA